MINICTNFEFLQYYFYSYVGRYEDQRTIANPRLLQQMIPEKKLWAIAKTKP